MPISSSAQPELTQVQDLSWPRHPRHRAAHRWERRFAGAVRAAAVPGPTGAGTRPAPARSQGLFPARTRGRVHRQGQGASALRVRGQSVATTVKHSAGGQFVAHAAALPGNRYDGHTLDTVIPQMEALIGNVLDRCITDAGYRGHNAPPDHKFKVYTTSQKRHLTPQIKREFKRRAGIATVIGHLTGHTPLGRKPLAHASGDAINAVLSAAGYNFRRLLAWLRFLLLRILIALGLAAQFTLALTRLVH